MLDSFSRLGSNSGRVENRPHDGGSPSRPVRSAFTLVELLVVIVIIGILIALLLPAIQAAREAARKMTCSAHLSMLAKACLGHESSQGNFPSGGWSANWMGDPDCGFSTRQPGGWAYNILPYMDALALHDLAKGIPFSRKRDILAKMAQTPQECYICPSRRQVIPCPLDIATYATPPGKLPNVGVMSVAARSDYAANCGSFWGSVNGQPGGWWRVDPPAAQFDPHKMPPLSFAGVNMMGYQSGVILQTYGVTSADIKDGLSSTYLVGEKYMNPDNYLNGLDGGDDNPLYLGFDWDTSRAGGSEMALDATYTLKRDQPGVANTYTFGSAHGATLNMAFCDGSVKGVSYDIDLAIHVRLTSRNGHNPASLP
jgi:prepilin-type N-terminal cleavage/methylation domain-containing protein/prepilin-type processing-associated H-X9-DG protein